MIDEIIDGQIVRVIQPHQARVNVTYKRQYGELPDAVTYDSAPEIIRGFVTEAIRTGGIPGIAADPEANLTDFMVEKFPPVNGVREHNIIEIRPKVEFGI